MPELATPEEVEQILKSWRATLALPRTGDAYVHVARSGVERLVDALATSQERVRELEMVRGAATAYEEAMKRAAMHWLNCVTCKADMQCMVHESLLDPERLALQSLRAALRGPESPA